MFLCTEDSKACKHNNPHTITPPSGNIFINILSFPFRSWQKLILVLCSPSVLRFERSSSPLHLTRGHLNGVISELNTCVTLQWAVNLIMKPGSVYSLYNYWTYKTQSKIHWFGSVYIVTRWWKSQFEAYSLSKLIDKQLCRTGNSIQSHQVIFE